MEGSRSQRAKRSPVSKLTGMRWPSVPEPENTSTKPQGRRGCQKSGTIGRTAVLDVAVFMFGKGFLKGPLDLDWNWRTGAFRDRPGPDLVAVDSGWQASQRTNLFRSVS